MVIMACNLWWTSPDRASIPVGQKGPGKSPEKPQVYLQRLFLLHQDPLSLCFGAMLPSQVAFLCGVKFMQPTWWKNTINTESVSPPATGTGSPQRLVQHCSPCLIFRRRNACDWSDGTAFFVGGVGWLDCKASDSCLWMKLFRATLGIR